MCVGKVAVGIGREGLTESVVALLVEAWESKDPQVDLHGSVKHDHYLQRLQVTPHPLFGLGHNTVMMCSILATST